MAGMKVHKELREALAELCGRDVYRDYLAHRSSAKQRGLTLSMTFPEWVKLWGDKLPERGYKGANMVMCRHGDAGNYVDGNVRIGSQKSNLEEAARLRRRAEVKEAWSFDGVDQSSSSDWLDNRRDMGPNTP